MHFDGRDGGESVGPTMPRLACKGHRRSARRVWVGANPGDFTPQAPPIPGNLTPGPGSGPAL
ncbi:hypothetical protein CT676_00330 [Bradyrhizobium sp. MOS001]|nr:hypothetical protein CT676_00330 [Bradyrhizobium sp. MOS001]